MIITITNHKGGVGKTTLSVNFSSYFLKYYNKILLIDIDAQAHSTLWLAPNIKEEEVKIYTQDVLRYAVLTDILYEPTIDRYVQDFIEVKQKDNHKLYLLPANLSLNIAKIELTPNPIAVFRIRDCFKMIAKHFDLVIIDTPPNLDLFTFASIASASGIIIPIQLNAMAIQGAKDILEYILPNTRTYYNSETKVLAIVINMFLKKTNIAKVGLNTAKEYFKNLLILPPLSRSIRIEELSVVKETLFGKTSGNKAIDEFIEIAEQIKERIEKIRG